MEIATTSKMGVVALQFLNSMGIWLNITWYISVNLYGTSTRFNVLQNIFFLYLFNAKTAGWLSLSRSLMLLRLSPIHNDLRSRQAFTLSFVLPSMSNNVFITYYIHFPGRASRLYYHARRVTPNKATQKICFTSSNEINFSNQILGEANSFQILSTF